MTLEELRDELPEGTIYLENPDYAEAAIGLTTDGNLVYSFEKMVQHLMDTDGMDEEEAMDFIDYNTLGAIPSMPEPRPLVLREFYL